MAAKVFLSRDFAPSFRALTPVSDPPSSSAHLHIKPQSLQYLHLGNDECVFEVVKHATME